MAFYICFFLFVTLTYDVILKPSVTFYAECLFQEIVVKMYNDLRVWGGDDYEW